MFPVGLTIGEDMGLFNSLLDMIARSLGRRIQGVEQLQAYRDSGRKGTEFSVESMVSESLANLMTMQFTMPVVGQSARAKALDMISTDFIRDYFTNAVSMAFLTGDCITVPAWNGRSMDNSVVTADNFAILGANGREITACIYIVDEKQERNGAKWTLLRLIELVPYTAYDGSQTYANRYRTYVAKNGVIQEDDAFKRFPDWSAYGEQAEWIIPNVDRLLIGRYRSFTLNPQNPNAQKGTPICYGASKPIEEIHYLVDKMHSEFALSEKAVFADRSLFTKEYQRDVDGNIQRSRMVLPEGRERLFMTMKSAGANGQLISEWAPTIQLQPYVDALEKQYQEVEKCIGISSGVLSNLNEQSYQNVDNVRKATVKTQSFIETGRKVAESYLDDMVYSWNAIYNYYNVTPVGDYDVEYKWSDEYINTFSDQQNAILAGNAIGATDAVDYRMLVMGESPEVARQRVEEIKGANASVQVYEEI